MALSASTQAALAHWHAMAAARDFSDLPSIMSPEAVFRSPMRHAPYAGAAQVVMILRNVITVFEQFQYQREFHCGEADVVLEFRAMVGDKELKGIDMIHFNEEGKISDFEVMIRPATALMALGEIMGRKIAASQAGAPAA